ncbi:MAG: hypothetical protein QM714_02800 [Nocardioides sp.]
MSRAPRRTPGQMAAADLTRARGEQRRLKALRNYQAAHPLLAESKEDE